MHAPVTRAAGARWSQLRSIAVFTAEWLWRDRGWQVIAALGALNVLIQSVGASSAGGAVEVVLRVQEHARLFLILLATVYAGELLWRDPDGRVAQLVHASPVPNRTLVIGRVLGVVASQGALIAALLVASWLGGALRSAALGAGALAPIGATLGIGVLWLWVPFTQWMVLSLAVHVLVRHKVIAHLCIIASWVLAFTLNANGVVSPWLRVADPPLLLPGEPLALAEALWRAAGWSALCATALAYCVVRWRAATSPR